MARSIRRTPRRARRTFRRRPRRRTRTRRGSRPDGMYKEKVTIKLDLRNDLPTRAYMNFHWIDNTAPSNVFNTNVRSGNTQYDQVLALYNFYRIYGLKIHYIPHVYGQSASNLVAPRQAFIGSTLGNDGSNATEQEIRNSRDYKPFDPTKEMKRFYRIGKYLRGTAAEAWQQYDSAYPPRYNMKTILQVEGDGFSSVGVTSLGQIYVTYYVAFKGRRAPTIIS